MAPDTLMYGRLTHKGKRTTLGRAPISTLMIRAVEEIRKLRKTDDTVIQIEISVSKLLDSTTFDSHALLEQEFATQLITDLDQESVFPGITMHRVGQAMGSESYLNYSMLCEPEKRIGFSNSHIEEWRERYRSEFPDCFPHFPKWIES